MRAHRRRRHGDRRRPGQRRAGRPGERPVRGGGLRLLGAGGHPGHQEPPEDRPHAADRPAVQAAGRAVLRGRRRPRGRRLGPGHPRGRRPLHRRAVHPHLARARQAVRAGADRRRQLRLLLRRQRGAARRLRRDHRHPGQLHRHRRPGHDRGRRAGRLCARRGRAGQHPGAQRRDRHRGGGRGRGHRRGQGLPVLLPGPHRELERARPAAAAPRSSRRTGARSTTSAP